MEFCTAVNCMDGRTQLPVISYLQEKFNAKYVDMITEAGPNKILSEEKNISLIEAIIDRIRISVERHGSQVIAVVGHHDCAKNPASKLQQGLHTQKAMEVIGKEFPHIKIIGLWVDEHWKISTVE